MKIITQISMTTAALIIAILLSATPNMAQESVFGVQLTPSKQTISKASNPAPSADAEHKTSIGSDSTTIGTGNSPTDTDSYWVESIDVDGNGDIETVNLLWDDEDKVLYLHDELDVACALTDGALVAVISRVPASAMPETRARRSRFLMLPP